MQLIIYHIMELWVNRLIFFKVNENQTVYYRYNNHLNYMQITGKTEEELLQEGYLVESIPEPELIEGKIAQLKYDGSEFYYEYTDRPLTIEEQLASKDAQIKVLETKTQQLNDDLSSFMDYILEGM